MFFWAPEVLLSKPPNGGGWGVLNLLKTGVLLASVKFPLEFRWQSPDIGGLEAPSLRLGRPGIEEFRNAYGTADSSCPLKLTQVLASNGLAGLQRRLTVKWTSSTPGNQHCWHWYSLPLLARLTAPPRRATQLLETLETRWQ